MIQIYSSDDTYLYEMIEDYKESDSHEEKNEIFNKCCAFIWSSKNKRRTYNKAIAFSIKKELFDSELGQVFYTWSDIEYKYYKSMTKDENWISLLRQKINNLYTRYFDKEIILNKEYMDLIKTPKRLYYEWISGIDMNPEIVTCKIDEAIYKSAQVKERLQREKMTLSWEEYKRVIEEILHRCFENCKLIEDYEDKTSISSRLDFLTEDHFYVGYFNKCLEGEMLKWQKRNYGLPQSSRKGYKRCKICGGLIENSGNKKMYCRECGTSKERERKRKIAHKYK